MIYIDLDDTLCRCPPRGWQTGLLQFFEHLCPLVKVFLPKCKHYDRMYALALEENVCIITASFNHAGSYWWLRVRQFPMIAITYVTFHDDKPELMCGQPYLDAADPRFLELLDDLIQTSHASA